MNFDNKSADISLIKRILPHRYPFLLVDQVIEINGFDNATGIKNITFNEPQFQGHFPATPIMPGVMIIEAMAQTAAVMVGVGLNLADKDMLIYFMAIDKCKFRRKVTPGDQLIMKLNTLRGKPGSKVWKFYGEASVGW
jgi:3-hydroxyacyl-[acyl-carrier-protein] dehydratase